LRSQLLSVPHLDTTLSKLILAKKPFALEFLAKLLEESQFGDPPLLYRTDFAASFDAVGLWIEQDPSNPTAAALFHDIHDSEGVVEGRDRRDQMEYIFMEWVQLFQHISTTDKNYSAFIIQLHRGKILADLPSSADFFRACIEFCITEYDNLTRTGASVATNCYIPTDAFAKMVTLLVKYQADDDSSEHLNKVQYLDSVLALVVFVFNHHNETRGENFCQKVFFRFFSSLLFEFRTVEHELGPYRERILETFAGCFLTLQPTFFPMFAFHWATLICHRYFMPKLLGTPNGQVTFTKLLSTYLNYIGMLLKDSHVQGVVKILHQGALRLFLVLHHDFPQYLAEYYFVIVDSIPAECTQLRNLVLSTLPPSVADFPDPFASGLQIKLLPSIKDEPTICGDVFAALRKVELKEIIDAIIADGRDPTDDQVDTIIKQLSESSSGSVNVDSSAVNSLVLYLAMDAIKAAGADGAPVFQMRDVRTALFSRLAIELNSYGMEFCTIKYYIKLTLHRTAFLP
jgi:CCR4-NOT transcription complex subunit 1